jgi:hypothetical protein
MLISLPLLQPQVSLHHTRNSPILLAFTTKLARMLRQFSILYAGGGGKESNKNISEKDSNHLIPLDSQYHLQQLLVHVVLVVKYPPILS